MLGLNMTLVGLTVVFLALIILAFVISLFAKVFSTSNRKDNESQQRQNLVETEVQDTLNDQSNVSDEELIAVLTAAIMASMGPNPDCKLQVKSYRHIPQTSPVWNVFGRKEYISGKL